MNIKEYVKRLEPSCMMACVGEPVSPYEGHLFRTVQPEQPERSRRSDCTTKLFQAMEDFTKQSNSTRLNLD